MITVAPDGFPMVEISEGWFAHLLPVTIYQVERSIWSRGVPWSYDDLGGESFSRPKWQDANRQSGPSFFVRTMRKRQMDEYALAWGKQCRPARVISLDQLNQLPALLETLEWDYIRDSLLQKTQKTRNGSRLDLRVLPLFGTLRGAFCNIWQLHSAISLELAIDSGGRLLYKDMFHGRSYRVNGTIELQRDMLLDCCFRLSFNILEGQ